MTLTTAQMPKHGYPAQKVKIAAKAFQKALFATTILCISTGDITKPPTVSEMANGATGEAGNGEAHENMPPYAAVNVFIYAGMPRS